MSLQHTESFIAYPQIVSDDTFTPENAQHILAARANLRRGGYDVFTPENTATASSGGIVVRPDPVTPGRAALTHSSAATGLSSTPITSAIRKRFPITRKTLIGGFSLYIPPEFVKSQAQNTRPCLRVFCPVGDANTAWQTSPASGVSGSEVFRINVDLMIRWATEAPLSDKSLVPGRVAFLEYSISETEIRVWVDNVIVLQKSHQLIRETIAISFEVTDTPAGVSTMTGPAGRWAISNWYNLFDDGVAPTTRLGPTTRVIGVRPDIDVETDFQRPNGYSSNASVAAQPLIDSPPVSLQAASVGDEDVYETLLDTETASGSLVHAVAVKVMAGSLDGANHTLRPLIRSQVGTEGGTPRTEALRYFPNFPVVATMVDAAVRPTDGCIFAVTSTGVYECPAGDGKSWSRRTDILGSAADVLCVGVRQDGGMVFGRTNGQLYVLMPNSDVAVAVAISGQTAALRSIAVSAEGAIVLVGAAGRCARFTGSATGTLSQASLWTSALITGATTSLNFTGVTVDKAGVFFATTDNQSAGAAVFRSANAGVSWTTSATGGGSYPNRNVVSDGDQIYLFTQYIHTGTSTATRRTSDSGVSWASVDSPNPNSGAKGSIVYAYAKGDEYYNRAGAINSGANSLAFIAQNGTTIYIPEPLDGQTTTTAATALPDGTWLLFSNDGKVMGFDPQAVDADLVAFSGFVPSYSVAAINPDTGVAWTPAEAAVSQFGMRVSS